MKKLVHILVMLMLLCGWALAGADETEAYKKSELQETSLNEDYWKKKQKRFDYSDEYQPEQKKKDKKKKSNEMPKLNLGPAAKIIFYGVIILGLAFLIYKIIASSSLVKNSRVKETHEITFENLEDHIHETELERFLREALEKNDYKQAVRVLFLMVLKASSEKGFIHWKKDKTNGDYLKEMYGHPGYQTFRTLTFIFERVWYGKYELNEQAYHAIADQFNTYLKAVAHG